MKQMENTLGHRRPAWAARLSWKGMGAALAAAAAGFLLGHISVEELMPFGPAYLMAAMLNKKTVNPYAALLGVLAAVCMALMGEEAPAFRLAVTVLPFAALSVIQLCKVRVRLWHALVSLAGSYLLAACAFRYHVFLYLLAAVMEMALAVVVTLVFHNAFGLLESPRRKALTDEEMVCLSFLALSFLLSIGEVEVWHITLAGCVACWLVLAAAFLVGGGGGAAVGAACGVALALSGGNFLLCAVLAFSGLVGGALRKLGRVGTAAGFLLMRFILELYTHQELDVLYPMAETGIALAAFLAAPQKFWVWALRCVDTNFLARRREGMDRARFQELTVGRLRELGRVFKDAAEAFSRRETGARGMSHMLAGIPQRACRDCVLWGDCWDKNFAATTAHMNKLYQKYEKTGDLGERDLGTSFRKKCLRPLKLTEVARDLFGEYALTCRWERKVEESRKAVGDQMASLSRILHALGREVEGEMHFYSQVEHALRTQLMQRGTEPKNILVHMAGGGLAVEMEVACCGGKGMCASSLRRLVSQAAGFPMTLVRKTECGRTKTCCLRYERAHKLEMVTGMASVCRTGSDCSGDSHAAGSVGGGRYMLLLCDGMGSGSRAARESGAAAALIEDFYKAGFEDDTILDSVNKLLLLSNPEEIYSTMDLCMVDLIAGRGHFMKFGSAHSYLIRGEMAKKLPAGTLPMGILEECAPREYVETLEPGDLIVLFTDGVGEMESADLDVHQAVMAATDLSHPQEVAEAILRAALEGAGGQAPDDMTVLVGQLRKGTAEEKEIAG